MIRKLTITLIAACAGLVLAACGGGGSSSVPGPTTTGNGDDLAAITAQNAELTAGVVAGVALGDGVFGAISAVNLPITTNPGGTGKILTSAAKLASPAQLFATSAGRFDCAESGSVDIDVTVADPLQPTEGDTYAMMFTACDDGTGAVTDGGIIISITGLDGDFATGEFLLGVSMELTAFQVSEAGETSGASGTVTVSIDRRVPLLTTITVSTSALATSSEGTAEAVSNLTITISEDEAMFPTAVSVETSFTLSSPRIGGEVLVSTSLTLQASGSEYPYVGELRITGAGNSAIVLIALDSNRVRLEIDIDGDGALDETVETTWEELMASAA